MRHNCSIFPQTQIKSRVKTTNTLSGNIIGEILDNMCICIRIINQMGGKMSKFNENELKVIGTHTRLGIPSSSRVFEVPSYNYPITPKENMLRILGGKNLSGFQTRPWKIMRSSHWLWMMPEQETSVEKTGCESMGIRTTYQSSHGKTRNKKTG